MFGTMGQHQLFIGNVQGKRRNLLQIPLAGQKAEVNLGKRRLFEQGQLAGIAEIAIHGALDQIEKVGNILLPFIKNLKRFAGHIKLLIRHASQVPG
ncbi:hypothetical protein D3C71_1149150 [compost metagenome]